MKCFKFQFKVPNSRTFKSSPEFLAIPDFWGKKYVDIVKTKCNQTDSEMKSPEVRNDITTTII